MQGTSGLYKNTKGAKRAQVFDALDTMCKRCINHEMCQGTGCEPYKTLAEYITGVK